MLLPGCVCCGSSPTKYVVAARGWTAPVLLGRTVSATLNDMLPVSGSTYSSTYGPTVDSSWSLFGGFWCQWGPVVTGTGTTQGNWSTGDGGTQVTVEVKWDGTYQWLRLRDDVYGSSAGFEAVFRRAVGSATTGSNVTGRVVFTASDIYSLQYAGAASTDYSGIGDLVYVATSASPTDFTGKTFDITFASGAPSVPWIKVGTRYYSVESLIGQTFSVTLASATYPVYISSFPPSWMSSSTPYSAACYSDTRTAGAHGKGCKVGVVSDGFSVGILAAGSLGDGGLPAIVYDCSVSGTGSSPAQARSTQALSLQFNADWFDAFASSGVVGTGPLAQCKTVNIGPGVNVNTGWDAAWGTGGDLTLYIR
jgi:hypothetical protein